MESRKTISQEEIEIVIDLVKKNNDNNDYDEIIERLYHLKEILYKQGKGRDLTPYIKKMARIRNIIRYYTSKKNRTETEEIKLQNAILEFNNSSKTKIARLIGGKVIYELKK